MKKFSFFFLNIILCIVFFSNAQVVIQSQKCFGGLQSDNGTGMQATSDGGFITAAYTGSTDLAGYNGGYNDYWVVKLDSNDSIEWQKCLGGTNGDDCSAIHQTFDGGYIVAGGTSSTDGDITGYHGGLADIWVVKLSSIGGIEWQKCLGGNDFDAAFDVKQTADSGYIVVGFATSQNGDVIGNHSNAGLSDLWVVKLTPAGLIDWQKCLGSTSQETGYSIQQTSDGGFIIAGSAIQLSNDGDCTGNTPYGASDYWVIKLNASHEIEWQKIYGGNSWEQLNSISQTIDGGYIAAGNSSSLNNGDVTGNHGNDDGWVIKLNADGTLNWQKSIGGSSTDRLQSIIQTSDSGYLAAGYTLSNDSDVEGNNGGIDAWIVKLNSSGTILWQKCLGGSEEDRAYTIVETAPNHYTLLGTTESSDSDVVGHIMYQDCWLVHLAPQTTASINDLSTGKINELNIFPNPTSSSINIKFKTESKKAEISMHNILGEKIMVQNITADKNTINKQLDLSDFSNGIYFLSIKTENENRVQRIIKQN